MAVIILFPANSCGYDFARIYRSDTLTGEYTLIDTINSIQLEYEDSDGDYSKYYQIAWYDGTTESTKIPVQSFVQNVINIIRVECKIDAAALPDSEIDFLTEQAKLAIQMDICTFHYGIQIYSLTDEIYQLPGYFYYDHNGGGAISILDIELFKQSTPITIYSPKTIVTPLEADFTDYWVKVPKLETTEILKVNFYTIGRDSKFLDLKTLVAYKICSIYFENLAANSITTSASSPFAKVKIGPISVENGTSSSSGTSITAIIDLSNKMAAKYKKLINNFKVGFYRVN